jgi:ADP-ribose pyrophosphatase YjhB (NUDIX family)
MPRRGPVTLRVPEGDDRMRKVCDDCGFVFYENPKLIVGAVCTWTNEAGEDLFLMIRRGIEPQLGYWSIPAGYMELQETSEAGAVREVWEEARARVEPDALLAVYNLPQSGSPDLSR